jgi:hypothetical protein
MEERERAEGAVVAAGWKGGGDRENGTPESGLGDGEASGEETEGVMH